jgi:hypothetical protein
MPTNPPRTPTRTISRSHSPSFSSTADSNQIKPRATNPLDSIELSQDHTVR